MVGVLPAARDDGKSRLRMLLLDAARSLGQAFPPSKAFSQKEWPQSSQLSLGSTLTPILIYIVAYY